MGQFIARSDGRIFREIDSEVIVISGDGRQMNMIGHGLTQINTD